MADDSGDFRMAGAYVELTVKDNTASGEEEARKRIEDAPPVKIPTELEPPKEDPLKDYTPPPVDVPTTASNPIDDAWRAKVNAALKATAADALNIPATPDTEEYRGELRAKLAEISASVKQALPAELADADRFKASVEALAEEVHEEVSAKIKVEVDQESLARTEAEIQAAMRASSTDTSGGGSSGGGGVNGMAVAIGAAAALGTGVIGGLALGAVPAAFTAIGVEAVKSNALVGQSFTSMTAAAKQSLSDGFAPFIPVLQSLANDGKNEMQALEPVFGQVASAAAPMLQTVGTGLIKAVDDGVRGSVPLIQTLGPVAQAVGDDFGKVEQGLGGFFKALDPGTAATGLEALGTDLQQILPAVGGLVNAVAPLSNALLADLGPAVRNVLDAVSAMSPVFSAAGGVLRALEPDVSFYGPMLLAAAGATKLLTGSFTDFSGALDKIKTLWQDADGEFDKGQSTLNALAKVVGINTQSARDAAVADAEAAVAKAKLVAAANDEAVATARAAVADNDTAKAKLTLMTAQDAATVSSKALASAQKDLAAAEETSAFSLGPVGAALGVVAALALPFVGNMMSGSNAANQMTGSLQRLQQAAGNTQSLSQLFQSDPQAEQQLNLLKQYGVTIQTLTDANNGNADAQQKVAAAAKEAATAAQAKFDEDQKQIASLQDISGMNASQLGQLHDLTQQWNTDKTARDAANATYKQAQDQANATAAAQQNLAQAAFTVTAASGQTVGTTQQLSSAFVQASAEVKAHGGDVNALTLQYLQFEQASGEATFSAEAFMKAQVQNAQSFLQAGDQFTQLARAVDSAQQSYSQASQGVASAGHGIEQASQGVANAQHSEQQAALAVAQAQQGVATAEHGVLTAEQQLANAQLSVTQAVQAKTAAIQAAQQQLESYQRQVTDQAGTEEAAELRLLQAQQAVNAAGLQNSNLKLTDLYNLAQVNPQYAQQYQLLLDLQDAQNNLNDTLANGTQLRQQAATADAQGVNGNQQVVSAQQQLVSAQQQQQAALYGVQQAQQGVTSASQQVANAQYQQQQAHLATEQAQYAEQQASIALQNALYSQRQASQQLSLARAADSTEIDLNTDAGVRNINTVIGLYDQQYALTGNTDLARQATEAQTDKLGLARGAVDNLITSIQAVPKQQAFSIVGTPSLNLTTLLQQASSEGISPYSLGLNANDVTLALGPRGSSYASGGPIAGPGGPRDDVIPIMASAGEYMQPADATDYYGTSIMDAIRAKTIPKELFGHFANGGSIALNGQALMGLNYRLAGWDAFLQGTSDILSQFGYPGMPSLPNQIGPVDFGAFATSGALGASAVPAASGSAAQAQAYAASQLGNFGWGPDQMPPLIRLWNQESGWNANAVNPSSGAYGIPQSLGHGHPYNLGDYANQIQWGLNYIKGRYGSPAAAWAHEVANNWYRDGGPVKFDTGGYAKPGYTPVINQTGVPEMLLPPGLTNTMETINSAVQGGALNGRTNGPTVNNYITQQPNEDGYALAHRLSAQTAWDMAHMVSG